MEKEKEKARILIVEDDPKTSAFIEQGIRAAGYNAVCAADGAAGVRLAEENVFDLAVVDIMLPVMDGFQLIRKLRSSRIMFPIIVLSAKASEENKIHGLEAGADDYLAKPFSLAELLARIQAQLRRAAHAAEPVELVFEDLRLNMLTRKVFRGEERIYLQPLEYQLLEYLMKNQGRVISRNTIMEHVWEYNFDPHTNIVESRISRLRDKIDKPFERKLIHTVRGFGYVIE